MSHGKQKPSRRIIAASLVAFLALSFSMSSQARSPSALIEFLASIGPAQSADDLRAMMQLIGEATGGRPLTSQEFSALSNYVRSSNVTVNAPGVNGQIALVVDGKAINGVMTGEAQLVAISKPYQQQFWEAVAKGERPPPMPTPRLIPGNQIGHSLLLDTEAAAHGIQQPLKPGAVMRPNAICNGANVKPPATSPAPATAPAPAAPTVGSPAAPTTTAATPPRPTWGSCLQRAGSGMGGGLVGGYFGQKVGGQLTGTREGAHAGGFLGGLGGMAGGLYLFGGMTATQALGAAFLSPYTIIAAEIAAVGYLAEDLTHSINEFDRLQAQLGTAPPSALDNVPGIYRPEHSTWYSHGDGSNAYFHYMNPFNWSW